MTLALLLTAVTGAWAEGTVYNTTVALKDLKAGDVLTNGFSLTTKTGQYIYVKGYKKDGGTAETGDYTQLNAYNSTFPGGVTISESGSTYTPYADGKDANAWIVSNWKDLGSATMLYLDGYNYTPAIDVTPVTGKTNEWTFTMPAFDVEIAPIYAPTAVFATDGEQVLTPTAAVGIYAESTDSIITPGKVAKTGDNVQGEVMYAVSTSATEQPALTAFSATLPTAKDITAAGDVYVWYYIKGADTPQGQTATAENTFNDSEICAEPIKVTVLNNKFDIQFNAANDNTIKAKKATVTVGGTAATVTEGKLEGVKMGSEVKVKANEGYKFRKVEVKKKAAVLLNNTITAWTAGSYAVPAGGLTYSDDDAITVSGDVTLTLTDGETLTLKKGISLTSGAKLTIQGNGTMNINGTNESTASTVAGSTGTLILTSGTLTATGGNGLGVDEDEMSTDNREYAGGNAINGNVTVSGGTLTAIGGNGGSIGNYSESSYGAVGGVAISGSVTVTDGIVTATGGNGGSIGVNAPNAYGGSGGAAIGGDATVNGGTWTASNGTNGGGDGGKAVAGTVTDNR